MKRWLMVVPLAMFLLVAVFLYRGLYLDPAGLLQAGVVVMAVIVRRRRVAPIDGADALSPEERKRLDQLLDTKTDD